MTKARRLVVRCWSWSLALIVSGFSSWAQLYGENAWDEFGIAVTGVGDVNGDGFDDVLVGAPRFENGQNDEGKAYLFGGSSSGVSSTPFWTTEGNQIGALLGHSVAGHPGVSDLDGDAVPDFAVGAPYNDTLSYSNNGAVWLYLGGSSPTLGGTILGISNNANIGQSSAIIIGVYRTAAVAAGSLTGNNAADIGGSVQIWGW